MKTHHEQLNRREFLKKATQAAAAVAASAGLGSAAIPLLAGAGEAGRPRASRISYFCNGEIHVNQVGQPEGKPLTTGHMDFKPSWSKTGNMLVCFRRTKDDLVTVNWKSAIFIINADGTGFHQLSDGTRTGTRRVKTFCLEIRHAPSARNTVSTTVNSSGRMDMASVIPVSTADSQLPRVSP